MMTMVITNVESAHAANEDDLAVNDTEFEGLEFDTSELGNTPFAMPADDAGEPGDSVEPPLPPTTSPAATAASSAEATTEAIVETGSEPGMEKVSPDDAQSQSQAEAFYRRLHGVRKQLHEQRELVAQQSVEALRLKDQAKAARDSLKEETESLSNIEREAEEFERLWESGEWVQRDWLSQDQAKGSYDQHHAGVTEDVPDDSPRRNDTAMAVDHAVTAPLSVLGLTPGRLETIEQAECRTVADLERLLREGGLQKLKGFGPKAVEAVSECLRKWREVNPVPDGAVPSVPLIEGQFDPTAWHAGAIAGTDGHPRTANPNSAGHDSSAEHDSGGSGFLFSSWDAGWMNANEKAPTPSTIPMPRESESLPVDDRSDPELTAAYAAGREAAIENQPVYSNPHPSGRGLWHAWDRGWQDNFRGDELE